MVAGTPIADKYFDVKLLSPNAAKKAAILKNKTAQGNSVWLGLVLPDAEVMKRERRRTEGLDKVRKRVLLHEQQLRAREAQSRKAQRDYALKLEERDKQGKRAPIHDYEHSSDDEESGKEEEKCGESDGRYGEGTGLELEAPDKAALISQLNESLAAELHDWHENGEFIFSIQPGEIVERGRQKLVAQYRPSPFFSKLYNFAYASISFVVSARAPRWSWNGVNDIPYYTPISAHQLKARIVEPSPVEPIKDAPLSPPPNDPGLAGEE